MLCYNHLNYLEPFVHLPWLLAATDVMFQGEPKKPASAKSEWTDLSYICNGQ
jgi:hypothetical protein